MATTIEQVYQRHLAKAKLEKTKPNLTSSQKAKITKRIKRLEQQMAWLVENHQTA